MPGKAPRSFWLDGGYDRASVDACPYAPQHRWWTFRLGDVLAEGRCHDPDEMFTICRACYVPRCGVVADGEDRCQYARHHEGYHRYKLSPPLKVGA